MGFRRSGLAALAVLVACAIAPAAWADPSASEKETARAMMDEGHARREAGDHPAALAQFRGADAIMHVPTTGLEVAREQIAIGQLVEARDTLERVIRSPSSPNEPDAFRAARKAADALDQEVAPRIPSLRITESGTASDAGLIVTVDGTSIPVAALIAPIKVNPGHHVVSASANGLTARKEIDVAEAQTAAVALALAPSMGSTPPSAGGDAAPVKATSSASNSGTVSWLRWGGVGLVGVGAVIGAVTGLMAISSTSSANKGCVNDRCPPATWGDIDSAHTTATVSTVAFAAAGVGAALFVTSFVIGGPSSTGATGRAVPAPTRVNAWVTPVSAGVGGTF